MLLSYYGRLQVALHEMLRIVRYDERSELLRIWKCNINIFFFIINFFLNKHRDINAAAEDFSGVHIFGAAATRWVEKSPITGEVKRIDRIESISRNVLPSAPAISTMSNLEIDVVQRLFRGPVSMAEYLSFQLPPFPIFLFFFRLFDRSIHVWGRHFAFRFRFRDNNIPKWVFLLLDRVDVFFFAKKASEGKRHFLLLFFFEWTRTSLFYYGLLSRF